MDALGERLQKTLNSSYEIEHELGRGGMATVYLARDLKHGRHVAIKVLEPELSAVLGAERFLTEIKTTAALQHPHILPLFDSGSADGHLFYVMPFVEGETLRARLSREKQLPVDNAVRIAEQVASALDYAHRHGVVHRDIKPENILLHDGQALVADFGIALAVQQAGGARMTQTGLSLGTPQYMSPEQAMGEREITARADIYALGAVTYEMLAGEPPFTGPNAQAIVAKVITEAPRALVTQRRTVPPHVDAAVMRALEKLPADRFGSAAEFSDALCGRIPSMSVSGAPSRAARPRWREPLVMTLGAVALVASSTAAALLWHTAHAPSAPERVVRFILATPDSVNQLSSAFPWPAAISPDGNAVAFLGSVEDQVLGGALYVQRLDELQAHRVPELDDAVDPVFSPDGRWVAFESGQKIEKVLVDGGQAEPIASLDRRVVVVNGLDWAPNGDVILGALVNSSASYVRFGLSRVSASGGSPIEFLTAANPRDSIALLQPVVTPDGRTVLFTITGPRLPRRLGAASLDGSSGIVPLDIRAMRALGVVDGTLVYVRADGVVMGVPFDSRGRRVTGAPVQVLDGTQPVSRYGASGLFLSRGGGLLAERNDYSGEFAWIGAPGIETIPAGFHRFASPRLSPNGRQIATMILSGDNRFDIWIYDIPAGTLFRLTSTGRASSPAWLPDGKHVMFVSPDSAGRAGVWVQAADGGAAAKEVFSTALSDYALPSPDGRSLLSYSVLGDPVVVLLEQPTAVRPYIKGTFLDPRFSPDGHWVASYSTESGRDEVYVHSYPDPSTKIQISSGGGKSPVWSADGTKIFYHLIGGPFIAATLSYSPTLHVVRRDTIIGAAVGHQLAGYSGLSAIGDASPDGTRLLAVLMAGDRRGLVVAPDWRPELARRMKQGVQGTVNSK